MVFAEGMAMEADGLEAGELLTLPGDPARPNRVERPRRAVAVVVGSGAAGRGVCRLKYR